MISNIGFRGFKKGITPVIATVLLLGITVAIGLTVYTQAQGMISGGADTGALERAQETDLELTPVYANESASQAQLMVRVTNTGERAINTSEFSIFFGPPDFPNPVTRDQLPGAWQVGSGNECFAGSSEVIAQGDFMECNTGVKFPDALESVEIVVRADEFDFDEGTTCEVNSNNARSC